jgi:hypothetical protein
LVAKTFRIRLRIENYLFNFLGQFQRWQAAAQEIHRDTFTEFLSAHFAKRWFEGRDGPSPPPCVHPPKDFDKAKKGTWRRGLKNLMQWIMLGRDHAYEGTLRGGFIPKGEGDLEEETAQI